MFKKKKKKIIFVEKIDKDSEIVFEIVQFFKIIEIMIFIDQ